MTIVEFLNARLDEDEHAVRAAIDPDRPGEHWHWIDPSDDTPAEPEDGYLRDASLRTVEEFPTRLSKERPELFSDGKGHLPAFAIHTAEEVPEGVARHIVRHDPARVLAEVEAKRAIVAELAEYWDEAHLTTEEYAAGNAKALLRSARHLAAVYADHPDYDESWRP